ncbi:hypothetical protein SNE40_017554 [Patella caerulea]|uniref:Uncharacterized protein n=1 Tax=Patella caerulea TaxID=87958 RepID=A0AAN8PG13_PATCE
MLQERTGPMGKLIEEICESSLKDLPNHLFTAYWQRQQFSDLTSRNLPEGWSILLLDFAENYRCESQDEIQFAHLGV